MSGFRFKQFYIDNGDCAMKVSTDGILLGAWANLGGATRILDVGCGTGLLSLMVKQRKPDSSVVAVEIDPMAHACAKHNIAASPWPDIDAELIDINEYECTQAFDLVISNPPYFVESLKGPDLRRNQARHTDSLSFDALLARFIQLSTPSGRLAVVLPTQGASQFEKLALEKGLFVSRRLQIRSTPVKNISRVLLELNKCPVEEVSGCQLSIHNEQGGYSHEYIALCKAFYLKMPD